MSQPAYVLIGAGGHAAEVALTVRRAGGTLSGVYAQDEPSSDILARLGVPWLGVPEACGGEPAVIGIGDSHVRARIAESVEAGAPLVDPLTATGPDLRIGVGSVVFALASVTTNVTLGKHVHVGRNSAIGHDVVLEDCVSIMPSAVLSGNVRVGRGAYVGTGALVRQGVSIGAGATVGMGAVVLRDVEAGTTVVGNPARPISAPTTKEVRA